MITKDTLSSLCLHLDFSFQDLYRVLLEAESEGILDNVDMTQVEKLILDPKTEMKSVKHLRDADEVKENKRRKTGAESEGMLHDTDIENVERMNKRRKIEAKQEVILHDIDTN